MDQTTLIILIAAIVAVLVVVVLLRSRSKPGHDLEGHGVGSGLAAAVEDTIGDLLGVDAHPDLPDADGDPDDLTRLKGLGPKAAAQLADLGISRYDQLAALTPDQLASVDARMGAFQGRLHRDRWAEQAGHLAQGDTAGFEVKFGKLGG